MIAHIKQVKANGKNQFEISEGGGLRYIATAPWMAMKLPFQAENMRSLSFQTPQGHEIFTTKYDVLDNTLKEAIPMKYLVGLPTTFDTFEVVKYGNVVGSFYLLRKKMFEKAFFIEYQGRIITGYSMAVGVMDVVSFYEGERQIAQLTKPLTVQNNLDEYFLHIAEGYEVLFEIMSFFTIYFDQMKYSNHGEVVSNKTTISYQVTRDNNRDKYDSNWIAQQFGDQESDQLNAYITSMRNQTKVVIRKGAKIFLLIPLVFIIPTLITLAIVFSAFFQNAERWDGVYEDSVSIVSQGESNSKVMPSYTTTNHRLKGSVGKMYGMETLWEYRASQQREVPITYSLTVESGKAKLLLITPDNTIITLSEVIVLEGEEHTSGESSLITETFHLEAGENRIKLVAEGAKLSYELYIEEGTFQ